MHAPPRSFARTPARALTRTRTMAWALALAVPLAPTLTEAQELSKDPRVADAINLLDRWIDAQRAYDQVPGVSAAVVYDQEVLWSAGFGLADIESQRPATPATMYSICSISKLFTSVAAMRLRDEGKFRLDDPVSSLLPWFQLENAHPGGPPITVEGLLTHSAGIPRESDHPYWTAPFDFPLHDDVVSGITDQETLYPAWKYFQYSNLGLTTVGEIVADLSGQPYGDYVRGHILVPLGMTSTTPEIGEVQGTEKLATGYSALRRDGNREKVEPFEGRGIAPAMGFASTVEDLARFASWQFRLLETGQEEILEPNTLREMQRVHFMDPGWSTAWGLGFSVSRRGEKTFVGHGGSCPGYRSNLELQIEDKIATIAMANAMINPGIFTRRAYEIIAPAIKAAKDKPDEGEETPAEFGVYIGAYDSYPWGGETHVIPWKGGLAVVSFPTDDPLGNLVRLKHIEGHTFRRIRDDESLGEERSFEVDSEGEVVRTWVHGNSSPRIR
ncbi:MAG: serine hydrolase domain-containing protein [Gemmatimonadota bacterium]